MVFGEHLFFLGKPWFLVKTWFLSKNMVFGFKHVFFGGTWLGPGVHKNITCLQDFFEGDKLSKKVRDIKTCKCDR